MKKRKKTGVAAKRSAKIKKNIKAFLTSEDGKITKKSVLKAAALLGTFAAISDSDTATATGHVNGTYNDLPGQRGYHVSHVSHGSHASHGSHGSHGQW